MSQKFPLPIEKFYEWEAKQPDKTFLRQAYNGQWEHTSWGKAGQEIRSMAAYLKSLNLPPHSNIAIISKNCEHWIMSDLAIMMAGHVSVPLYPTIPADLIRYCLEHSQSKVCFVGKLDDWSKQRAGVPEGVQCITYPRWTEQGEGYVTWEDVVKQTPPLTGNPVPDYEDIATIIYTSGTTGLPKGVVHTFHSISFAANKAFNLIGNIGPGDRFFSYLPLSHIAERALVELGCIYSGGSMSFAETLDTFAANLKDTRPTIFLAVPRIWTKFQMGILSKMPQSRLNLLLMIPVVNNLIRKKIQEGLGLDQAKMLFTGAAPMPAVTMEWFEKLGMVIYEAYAMTENCAYSHLSLPGKRKPGFVGQTLPDNDVRLSEEGEIQVRSEAIMRGYYKDEEKTKETITEDGWLCTGDQGEIDADGFLKITGRVKDIFKTDKGKYVAPAPIENELSKNTLIEQVCVVGANLPQTMAMVVLSADGKALDRSDIAKRLEETMHEVNQVLDKHEKMKKMIVVNEEWTVDNNLLTPTLKVKRNVLEKQKQDRYSAWYSAEEIVVWEG